VLLLQAEGVDVNQHQAKDLIALWIADFEVRADAQALADVRTLDEWAEAVPFRSWRSSHDSHDRRVTVYETSRTYHAFAGPTSDAARSKAAAWVREQESSGK